MPLLSLDFRKKFKSEIDGLNWLTDKLDYRLTLAAEERTDFLTLVWMLLKDINKQVEAKAFASITDEIELFVEMLSLLNDKALESVVEILTNQVSCLLTPLITTMNELFIQGDGNAEHLQEVEKFMNILKLVNREAEEKNSIFQTQARDEVRAQSVFRESKMVSEEFC